MTIKIGICGAAGRMGKTILEVCKNIKDVKICAAIEHPDSPYIGHDAGEVAGIGNLGVQITDSISSSSNKVDVFIDFTLADSVIQNINECESLGCSMVIGTTGLNDEAKARIQSAAKNISIVFAPNMSIGVNLCFRLLEVAASTIGKDADVEIVEAHHRDKKDAPSGTALSLGDYAALGRKTSLNKSKILDRTKKLSSRKKGDIGFSVTRGGEIAGEHIVSFIGENDRIDLVHKANNRSIFVKGALDAAIFLSKKKSGFYTMNDLLFNK